MKHWLITILGMLQCGCVSRMFYYPDDKVYEEPPATAEHLRFHSGDGTRLHGWWLPATKEDVLGTVVHFHGNAANLSGHYCQVDWLPEQGFNVMLFDYRGYGQSEGTPNRAGVYQDSLAALRFAARRSENLFVLGQSLGGANALAVLGRNDMPEVKAVVIDSSFFSYRSIVRDKISQIRLLRHVRWPLSFLVVGNRYSSGPVVGRISPTPMMFFHGTADRVIPYHHGPWLADAAGPSAKLVTIEDGYHCDLFLRYGVRYQDQVTEFFREALVSPGK